MIGPLSIEQLAVLLGIGVTLTGLLGWYVVAKVREKFAPIATVETLGGRMAQMEQRLAQTVTHSEIGEVYRRLAALEAQGGVVVERIGHVQEANRRMEGKIDRLADALLMIEKARGGA